MWQNSVAPVLSHTSRGMQSSSLYLRTQPNCHGQAKVSLLVDNRPVAPLPLLSLPLPRSRAVWLVAARRPERHTQPRLGELYGGAQRKLPTHRIKFWINGSCFKSINCGVVCYTASDNSYIFFLLEIKRWILFSSDTCYSFMTLISITKLLGGKSVIVNQNFLNISNRNVCVRYFIHFMGNFFFFFCHQKLSMWP